MSSLDKKHIEKLIERYRLNKASDDEIEVLFTLIKSDKIKGAFLKDMDKEIESIEEVKVNENQIKRFPLFKVLAAACTLLFLSFGIFWYLKTKDTTVEVDGFISSQNANAVLVLPTGESIELSSLHKGIRVKADELLYEDGSKIQGDYENNATMNSTLLTLKTPRGSHYEIYLSDGTKVWLNSETKLKYPMEFSGDFREVELEGEAYFEVVKNLRNPFVVNTNEQKIEVLGTSFNVSNYSDDDYLSTTLIEGSVKVLSKGGTKGNKNLVQIEEILLPGEQFEIDQLNQLVHINKVDIESTLAWREGYFHFNKTDLSQVMREISRWYDLEIVYVGERPNEKYTGIVSRNKGISTVLSFLEMGGGVELNLVPVSEEGIAVLEVRKAP